MTRDETPFLWPLNVLISWFILLKNLISPFSKPIYFLFDLLQQTIDST